MTINRSKRLLRRIGLALVLLFLIATGLPAVDLQKKPMRETATVPADSSIKKRLGAVEDYLAEKRWTEAIEVLQEICQTDGRMLVQVEQGTAGGTGGYVNVTTRCNVLLSRLPAEGLVAYRKKVDPQARRWFDQWKQTRDTAELRRIVRQAYLSSYGDDALWALAEVAWDQGDFASARLYWTQLVPLGQEGRSAHLPTVLRYPDSERTTAEVLSRLVLCRLMEGEPERAAAEQRLLAAFYPTAEATIAGRTGLLSDVLKRVLEDASQWDQQTGIREVSTFGLTPSRCGTLASAVEIGASRWSQPLTPNLLTRPEQFNTTPDQGPLSYFPVVYQDIVFVNDAERIWAWNVLTGEPAWPTERGASDVSEPNAVDGFRNRRLGNSGESVPSGGVYLSDTGDGSRIPNHASAGVPYFTMTIADGRLYARMGSPGVNPAQHEASLASDLVCLDIATQGKLVWKIAAADLLKDGVKSWRYEGSPVVVGGRAYVALSCRRPQLEFCIACLDAATGSLLWHRQVVTARSAVEDHQNRVSHLLLTAGAGKLFFSTDAGAVVAINADDGQLEWAMTYESLPQRISELSNHLRQSLTPAMFHEGLLFVAPNDCDRLFCIEADSGRVRWQRHHPQGERWRHLLGVGPGGESGRLIVSGKSLWWLDIAKDQIVFDPQSAGFGGGAHPAEQDGYGRGILAGEVIYWPARESIKIFNARTGMMIGSKPLHTSQSAQTAGNLVLAQEMLLVAQPERLVAYCEYSLLKQRLERELSERRVLDNAGAVADASASQRGRAKRLDVSAILGQLADIEVATGNLESAADDLRQATQTAKQAGQDPARFRNRLLDVLRQSARKSLATGRTAEVLDQLVEARQLAIKPADIADILMELGDVELARDRPVVAIDRWQEILEDDRLRDVPYRQSKAGKAAVAAISQLISRQGRIVYFGVERRAAEKIAALTKEHDLEGLRNALHQYPNSEAVPRAWKHLAILERQAGRMHGSLAIHARVLQESTEPNDKAAAIAEWADSLDAAGYWRPAQRAWNQLTSKELMNEEIPFDGALVTAQALANSRLSRPEYAALQSQQPSVSGYLEQAWSIPLDAGKDPADARVPDGLSPHSKVIIPRQQPPADDLECVLVHQRSLRTDASGSEWICVDRRTGSIRWKRILESPLRWAAYAETHLLLATEADLSAVTLEEGRDLWTTPLIAKSESESRPENPDTMASNASPPAAASNDSMPVQLAVSDHWVFSFDTRAGLTAFDARTGQKAWSFVPARGSLQREWTCGSRRIALQTLHPAVTWLVNVSAERSVVERIGTSERWLQGPNLDDDTTLVQVTEDRRIESRTVQSGRRLWSYQGGMSFAYVDPEVWTSAGRLLVTVDGTTLAAINRFSGRPDWSVGLADRPLDNPATQVVTVGDATFAASHGLLRRISLTYGECQWERYLGASTDQWGIAGCGATIAVWPIPGRSRGNESTASLPFIVWCDADSGRILQRWNIDKDERLINVSGSAQDCLVQTDQTLTAFRAPYD